MSLHKTFDKDGKATEIIATGKDAVLAEAAPDLLAACEEGSKRISFLLNKIIKAESFPEVIILKRIEIDKTESCISYIKEAIAKAKG